MDFGLGLIIGLVIGLLINWVMEPLFKRHAPSVPGESGNRQESFVESRRPTDPPEPEPPAAPAKIMKVVLRERDEFERIKGIGPVFARRLNEAGIFTFEQLADTPAGRIRQMVAAEDWQDVDVQEWIDEARQLAARQQA